MGRSALLEWRHISTLLKQDSRGSAHTSIQECASSYKSATYWEHPPVLGGDEASERQRGHRSKLDPEFNWNFENIVSSENYMEREIHWEALPKPKVATLVRRFLCLDVDSGNDPNFPGNPRIPVNHDSPGNLIPKCRGPRGFDPSYAGSQTRLQGEVFGPILHGYHNIGVHFGHANRITRRRKASRCAKKCSVFASL
ncbi:hypothetical protein AAMO2058_000986500 [Amorphochlora amoebiformis]